MVDTREELVYLLGQACEIEHGLMCEYLYAQFSLKRGLDEGLTPDQLSRVRAWESALISVIKQEMLHLALATNILTAVGAAPHFERPNFPILSRWYPPGVQIALAPFGERSLRHFIYLERPEGMALQDAAGFAAARHARPLTIGEHAPEPLGRGRPVMGHENLNAVGDRRIADGHSRRHTEHLRYCFGNPWRSSRLGRLVWVIHLSGHQDRC
jgi:hypothetical protein